MPAPIDVFISFVQEDDALRNDLEKHLTALRRDSLIRDWSDRRIIAGQDRRKEVDARLESARVILLLVSADFLASDYCDEVEVARALARERAGEARVILVSVRACDQSLEQFKGLAVLPRNGKAVTSWSSRDEGWKDVALGLREILGQLAGPRGPYRKLTPSYPDDTIRALSERREAARDRKRALLEAGGSTAEVDKEILDLRRQLREGGQLRAGDSLGDGRYLLLERIGRGGFAIVWKAIDRERGEQVAIKVLHSELAGDSVRRERFIRGARIMAELAHEAVVRVLEPHGEDGGYHYFVMELVTGGDLRRAVLEKRVGGEAVLPIILKVGEALAKAHAEGYVHRDVKPANILLDEAGAPRLTDFDLVGGANTTGGTRTGAMGTFIYAAPELLDRPQDADARADVYGLGMTAVFALHGEELSLNVMRDAEVLIKELSCGPSATALLIKGVLIQAVEWRAQRRFADAASFCKALRAAWALRKEEPSELPLPFPSSDGPAAFRSRLLEGQPVVAAFRSGLSDRKRVRINTSDSPAEPPETADISMLRILSRSSWARWLGVGALVLVGGAGAWRWLKVPNPQTSDLHIDADIIDAGEIASASASGAAPPAPPLTAQQDAKAPKATTEPAKADPEAMRKETLHLLNRGRLKDAILKAREAIAADPGDANGYLYLGSALQDSGKWKDGIEAYCECVRNATRGPINECRQMGGHK
jgi:eukaryotic-like serine/threonine-protein kinase